VLQCAPPHPPSTRASVSILPGAVVLICPMSCLEARLNPLTHSSIVFSDMKTRCLAVWRSLPWEEALRTTVCHFWTYHKRPPLLTSGQSSWLQIQRSRFYSWCYHSFWEVMSLEWGPLSLVSTIEEPLGRNCSVSALESREYGRGNPLRWPRDTRSNFVDKRRSFGRYSSLAD
jgi:hypothetical protein